MGVVCEILMQVYMQELWMYGCVGKDVICNKSGKWYLLESCCHIIFLLRNYCTIVVSRSTIREMSSFSWHYVQYRESARCSLHARLLTYCTATLLNKLPIFFNIHHVQILIDSRCVDDYVDHLILFKVRKHHLYCEYQKREI